MVYGARPGIGNHPVDVTQGAPHYELNTHPSATYFLPCCSLLVVVISFHLRKIQLSVTRDGIFSPYTLGVG